MLEVQKHSIYAVFPHWHNKQDRSTIFYLYEIAEQTFINSHDKWDWYAIDKCVFQRLYRKKERTISVLALETLSCGQVRDCVCRDEMFLHDAESSFVKLYPEESVESEVNTIYKFSSRGKS